MIEWGDSLETHAVALHVKERPTCSGGREESKAAAG